MIGKAPFQFHYFLVPLRDVRKGKSNLGWRQRIRSVAFKEAAGCNCADLIIFQKRLCKLLLLLLLSLLTR
jgi:hypothetical protein